MLRRGLIQAYANIWDTVLRAMDPSLAVLAGWLAYFLARHSWVVPDNYLLMIVLTTLLIVILFPAFRLYGSWRGESIGAELRTLLMAWGTVISTTLLLGVATQTTSQFSRLWIGYWALSGAVSLLLFRLLLRQCLRWLRSQGFNQRRVVIVGTGALATGVANRLLSTPWLGLKLLGFFEDEPVDLNHSKLVQPVLGGLEQLADYIKQHWVDQVWVVIPWSHQEVINKVLYNLRYSTTDVRVVLDIFGYRLLNTSLTEVAGMPMLDLSRSPLHGINRLLKAIEDRLLAYLILVLVSPLMIAIAIGVKLSSPGPVLFCQKRHGYNGREVEIWKFRTMKMHQEEDDRVTQATCDDPRVTRFGAFLRRTSLDELPQFINVLQGRMSIVGPRPHAVVHNEYYKYQIDRYVLRHKVKPGITGWAQINGFRGEIETLEKMQQRLEYDLYYIENWSLWFDLKIILLTLCKGFVHKNAY